MLNAFDNAKEKDRAHKTPTYRGRVAEVQFRNWLSNFLPKKYGVTSGYIISQGIKEKVKIPHFDVIIYNQLESPVLWLEDNADVSSGGMSRAIPAEYVQAVIEVKSSFDGTNAEKAMRHLFELEPLLKKIDPDNARFNMHLPPAFFCAVVYFEDSRGQRSNKSAMARAFTYRPLRGFFGGIILRANDASPDESVRMLFMASKTKFNPSVGDTPLSIIEAPMANHHTAANGYYIGGMMHQNEAAFALFAFDLVALLNGTYETGRISSWHGLNWISVDGKEGR